MVTCPLDKPVRCATDNICKASYRSCTMDLQSNSLQIIKPLILRTNCTTDYFLCASGCSLEPCPEWTTCTRPSDVQCWDGSCVSNSTLCRSNLTGCPFNIPEKCPYTAKCVKNATLECGDTSEAQLSLNQACLNYDSVACEIGYCTSAESSCSNTFPATCSNWLYPNTLKQDNPQLEKNKCY